MNLQQTFTDLHSQGLTHRQIAETLNDSGIPAQSGGEWTRDAARNYWRRNVNTDMTDRRPPQPDWQVPNRHDVESAYTIKRHSERLPVSQEWIDDYTLASGIGLIYEVKTKPIQTEPGIISTLEKTGVGTVGIISDMH